MTLSRLAALPLLLSLTLAQAAGEEPLLRYTVQPGDTLIGLGRTVLVSPRAWGEVARLNGLADPDRIWPRQTLDIPLRLLRHSQPPARLVEVQGAVTVGGQPVQAGAALPPGVLLATPAHGSAVVQLGDGSRVRVVPDTQATLTEHRRYELRGAAAENAPADGLFAASLRLLRGTLEVLAAQVRRARPLEVDTPTAVIGVRGTDYRVRYDASQATRTEVLEGRVQADPRAAGAGAGAAVPAGFGAALPEGQPPTVVALLPPPDLSRLPARLEGQPLALDVPGSSGRLRLQLAEDAHFDRLHLDRSVAAGSALALDGLPEGRWHLRLRQIDALGIEGRDAVGVLEWKPRSAVARLQPLPGPVAPGTLGLHWSALPGVARYRVQVAADAAFGEIEHQFEVEDTQARLVLARPGRHHWRVAGVDGTGALLSWSDAETADVAR